MIDNCSSLGFAYKDTFVPESQAGVTIKFPQDELKSISINGFSALVQISAGFMGASTILLEASSNVVNVFGLLDNVAGIDPTSVTVSSTSCSVTVTMEEMETPVTINVPSGPNSNILSVKGTVAGGSLVDGTSNALVIEGNVQEALLVSGNSNSLVTSTSCDNVSTEQVSNVFYVPSVQVSENSLACTIDACQLQCTGGSGDICSCSSNCDSTLTSKALRVKSAWSMLWIVGIFAFAMATVS